MARGPIMISAHLALPYAELRVMCRSSGKLFADT